MTIPHLATTASDATDTPPKRRGRPPKRATPPAVPPSCLHRLDERTKRAIERAARLMEENAVYRTEAISNPASVRAYLTIKLAGLPHEEFHAIWLDSQNQLIAFERMFVGTLTQVGVYPREVVKAALLHNAAAVILAHNHPSGDNGPSKADILLTESLKKALALVDVRVHDHFIVAGTAYPFSFAESGLL